MNVSLTKMRNLLWVIEQIKNTNECRCSSPILLTPISLNNQSLICSWRLFDDLFNLSKWKLLKMLNTYPHRERGIVSSNLNIPFLASRRIILKKIILRISQNILVIEREKQEIWERMRISKEKRLNSFH